MSGWWILVIVCGVLIAVGIVVIILDLNFWLTDFVWIISTCFTIVLFICLIIFTIFAIKTPLDAENEYRVFLEKRAIIEEVIDDSNSLENVGINNIIIETNNWLANAKANKKVYGFFSPYYKLDVDNIKPIKIPLLTENAEDHNE